MTGYLMALLLVLPFAVLGGCKRRGDEASAALDTRPVNYEAAQGMRLGVGLNDVSGDVRNPGCLEAINLMPAELAGGNGQEATFSTVMVESHQDLMQALELSAAAQIAATNPKNEAKATAKTKFGLGTSFSLNRYSFHVLVAARILNRTDFLKEPKLKEDVRAALAANPEAGLTEFRRQCGDSYMVGATSGGEFYAVIEVATSTEKEKEKLKGEWNLLGQGGSVKGATQGEVESRVASVLKGKTVRAWTFQQGGEGEAEVGLVLSWDEVLTRMRRLADSAKIGKNPRPLVATFTDYATLRAPLPNSYFEKLEKAKQVLDELTGHLSKFLDLRADINYVLENVNSFQNVDLAALNKAKETIEQSAREINAMMTRCEYNLDACVVMQLPQVSDAVLPKRRVTTAQLEAERVSIKSKVGFLDLRAIKDYFSQPECFVAIRAGRQGDRNAIVVHRTAVEYGEQRCKNLTADVSVPVSIILDAFRRQGIAPEQGYVEYGAYEADRWKDDLLGTSSVAFKEMQNGAVARGVSQKAINVEVFFELVN